MRPFDIAFMHATSHGIAAAIAMPTGPDSVPESVMSRLHPEEAEVAKATKGYRTPQYVAGRIAMHTALHHLGAKDQPVLSTRALDIGVAIRFAERMGNSRRPAGNLFVASEFN